MPDSTPITPGERTVLVQRHSALTYISLAFNGVILLLILIGIVSHHDKKPEDKDRGHHGWAEHGGDRDGFHGRFDRMDRGWGHDRFAHEGDACPMCGRDGDDHHGFDRGDEHGWGGDRGSDMRAHGWGDHHDFGMEDHGWGGGPGLDDHSPMTPPSAEEMTDRFMLMLTPKLALTDAEAAQIRPIIQNGITQLQKDMEAQKEAHQKMIEDDKTKIRAALTPDQQKEFDALTAGMGGAPAPAPANK